MFEMIQWCFFLFQVVSFLRATFQLKVLSIVLYIQDYSNIANNLNLEYLDIAIQGVSKK